MRSVCCLMLLLAGSCTIPSADDAEIGCGLDATISPRCPGYVAPIDAGDAGTSADAGVGSDAGPTDASAEGGA